MRILRQLNCAGRFPSSISHHPIDQMSVNAAFLQTSDAGEGKSHPTPELFTEQRDSTSLKMIVLIWIFAPGASQWHKASK